MTATKTNHWKLGMFVAVGLGVGLGSIFWIGAQRFRRATESRVTYFDESVQGLDVGAPVKMRGVTIGNVSEITIAPDRRRVQVTAEIYVDLWVRLGLGSESELRSGVAGPEDLRVQISSTGITGVKFLLVDFFPHEGAPPDLGFAPPYNYIPSTPSTLKSIEDGFTVLAEELPGALATFQSLAESLDRSVNAVDFSQLNTRLDGLLTKTESLVSRADTKLSEMDVRSISDDARSAVASLRDTMQRADKLLARLGNEGGPLERMATNFEELSAEGGNLVATARESLAAADLPATTASLRGSLGEFALIGIEVQETLSLLRETLVAVQALASYIEREPGALLRGRAEDFPPPTIGD